MIVARFSRRDPICGVGLRVAGIFLLGILLTGARATPESRSILLEESVFSRAEGLRHQKMGSLRMAAMSYQHAIHLNPGYAAAYNDLGVVLESLEDVKGAEKAYRAALQLDPQMVAAHSNLALLYEAKGMVKEAATHWAARVRIGPPIDRWALTARAKLVQYNLSVPQSPELVVKKQKAMESLKEAKRKEPKKEPTARPRELQQAREIQKQEAQRRAQEEKKQRAASEWAEKRWRAMEKALEKSRQKAVQTAPSMKKKQPEKKQPEKVMKEREPSTPVPEALSIAQELSRQKEKVRRETTREILQRAVTAMRLGRYEEATVLFQQILALEPGDREAQEGLKRSKTAFEKAAGAVGGPATAPGPAARAAKLPSAS